MGHSEKNKWKKAPLKTILICSRRVWSSVSESIYRNCSICNPFCALQAHQKTLLKCITC